MRLVTDAALAAAGAVTAMVTMVAMVSGKFRSAVRGWLSRGSRAESMIAQVEMLTARVAAAEAAVDAIRHSYDERDAARSREIEDLKAEVASLRAAQTENAVLRQRIADLEREIATIESIRTIGCLNAPRCPRRRDPEATTYEGETE